MQVNDSYSLFKIRGVWYIQVCSNYKRKTKSLSTKSEKEAKSRAKIVFPILLENIKNSTSDLSFIELSEKWLQFDHGWTERTLSEYTRYITLYNKKKPFPLNPTTRSMHIRCINACWNWGFNQGLVTKMEKLKVPKSTPRVITLNDVNIIDNFQPVEFRQFCVILVETGIRVKELRTWRKTDQNHGDMWIRVNAKMGGKRMIRLSEKADQIIQEIDGFDFSKRMTSHWWRKNYDGECQLRDLRRTFAVNLYRKGIPMFTISRLMGHSTLSMTEWYLKPFTIDEIFL